MTDQLELPPFVARLPRNGLSRRLGRAGARRRRRPDGGRARPTSSASARSVPDRAGGTASGSSRTRTSLAFPAG